MIFGGNPLFIIYLIPVFLVSLSFLEASHAYISYRLGDPTAKNMGRLTLNPIKHIDILGAIMMIVSGFGWAKPVPINPLYYKNRKKGTMLVSLAGPFSNMLLALAASFPLFYLYYKYGTQNVDSFNFTSIAYNLCSLFYIINLNLAAFNLIPVPPLDGSKILSGILPSRLYFRFMQYENYIGIIFLLIVFVFPGALNTIMNPITGVLGMLIRLIAEPVVGLLL
jgi:Zn-dependent protease